MRKLVLSFLFLLFASQARAAIVSVDNTFVAGDQYSANFHTNLNRDIVQLEDGINNIATTQIVDDTLTEADMADEINPRVRTYEGAACEFVYTGLLPTTTSGTLTISIPAGTAYPRGYRVNKASATSRAVTGNCSAGGLTGCWEYADLDQSGNFTYSDVAIGASAPSVASNSIRLFRASSDNTQVNDVQDLRRTSCADGPFSAIADASGEGTLDDMLKNGAYPRRSSVVGRTPVGWARGAFVSWDTATTFKVTPGSLYINGKYRAVSTDITVTTSTDDPTTGGSGLDTGAIANSTLYYVYAVADQSGVKTYSISYSTSATAPSGITNYRLLGQIKTDATALFTSKDQFTVHGINERELPGAMVNLNALSGTPTIDYAYNIASLTDSATGDITLNYINRFNSADYIVVGSTERATGSGGYVSVSNATQPSTTVTRIQTNDNNGGALVDHPWTSVVVFGDVKR